MHIEKKLHNGIKLLKKKDFLEAIHNLEEYIAHNDTNYLAYYYLGLAYIFRELYDEAYTHISKAYQLNKNDPNIINAIAFLNLKLNNVDEAINFWLDILDNDKNNHTARRNLDKVKKSKNSEKLISTASPDEFISFKLKKDLNLKIPKIWIFPKIRIRRRYLRRAGIGLIAIIALFIIFKYIIIPPDRLKTNKFNIVSPEKLKSIKLPDMEEDYVIDKNIKKSIFTLKPKEVKKIFYNTKKFIKAQYFNKATISINKVLHSNAGMIIKERFKILKSFISSLETFKLKDNILYSNLMNLPLLYEDIQVVWKGKIEDISVDEDAQAT